jgi:hypothetical protein
MDLTESIVPRSDQINADDLIAGPVTYTIREVIKGAAEPPFDFLLVETDRAYRPSKTMRRVIVNAWGPEASAYVGRRLTLYREPSIKFGGQVVGGIRISHMSHIDGRVEVLAQVTRGKRRHPVVIPCSGGWGFGARDHPCHSRCSSPICGTGRDPHRPWIHLRARTEYALLEYNIWVHHGRVLRPPASFLARGQRRRNDFPRRTRLAA